MLSYKFRIYPNANQIKILEEYLNSCKDMYNLLVDEVKKAERENKNISINDLKNIVSEKSKLFHKFTKVYPRLLEMMAFQLWNNMNVLKKMGLNASRLKFKKRIKTLNYNRRGFSVNLENKRIFLEGVGNVKIKIHREFYGDLRGIIVKKEADRWFAIFQIENEEKTEAKKTNRAVGIDVGIENFAVDSDGNVIANPGYLEKEIDKIVYLCKRLSLKKKNSKNSQKLRLKIERLYNKIRNRRRDFLHKLSKYYVDNYDFICVEKLDIEKMIKQRLASRLRIKDAAWRRFVQMLFYKAQRAGKKVFLVDSRDTSQRCSRCGCLNRKILKLSDRVFICRACGFKSDRDFNAAVNILKSGLGRPFVPVDTYDSRERSRLEKVPLLRTISVKEVIEGRVLSMRQEARSNE